MNTLQRTTLARVGPGQPPGLTQVRSLVLQGAPAYRNMDIIPSPQSRVGQILWQPRRKLPPSCKKSRNDREERLRTGRNMASEFAAEGTGPTVTPPDTSTARDQETGPASDDDEDGSGNDSWAESRKHPRFPTIQNGLMNLPTFCEIIK